MDFLNSGCIDHRLLSNIAKCENYFVTEISLSVRSRPKKTQEEHHNILTEGSQWASGRQFLKYFEKIRKR